MAYNLMFFIELSMEIRMSFVQPMLNSPFVFSENDEYDYKNNFTPLCTTFDIVHDMTCLDLFCKGQFVLNFSGGMPLSDSLSTFLTLIATA